MILLFQKISAAAGMVWIAGKIIYAYGYYSEIDGNFHSQKTKSGTITCLM
jgi:hypothetical protein